MFNVTVNYTTISESKDQSGQTTYLVPRTFRDKNGARLEACVLVERRGQEWQPVRKLSGSIDRFSLASSFAFQSASSNASSGVGATLSYSRLSYDQGSNTFLAGEELVRDRDGSLVLQSRLIQFPEGHKMGRNDHTELLEYHYDDSAWAV